MKKTLFPSCLLLLLLVTLSSHEFWLEPEKFIYSRGEAINIRFHVGENFEGVNWKGNHSRINSLTIYYGGVQDDLSAYINDDEGDSLQLSIYDECTALIAFNSTNSFLTLEPDKFNAYLQEDGLSNAIAYRKENNETDSTGREYYQRCAKVLLQIGSQKDNAFKTPTSLPLDIIPLSNPYVLKNNDSLKVKVLFNKQPLTDALIKIWNRDKDSTSKKEISTDNNGEAVFAVSTSGKWMVSAVKMVRLQNDPQAHWQSYWGSLTWGYK